MWRNVIAYLSRLRISVFPPDSDHAKCSSRFKVDLSRFFQRRMKSTFCIQSAYVDLTTFTVEVSQITLGLVTRAVPPLAIWLNAYCTVIVRVIKLRVGVYPRVRSGRGRNFRRGSGTGT